MPQCRGLQGSPAGPADALQRHIALRGPAARRGPQPVEAAGRTRAGVKARPSTWWSGPVGDADVDEHEEARAYCREMRFIAASITATIKSGPIKSMSDPSPLRQQETTPDDRLDSWKEIAAYL